MRTARTIILSVLATLAVLAAAGVGYVYSGAFNVAATDPHSGLMRWLLDTTFHESVHSRTADITPPENLVSEQRVQRGARLYASMCVMCHLAPGRQPTEIHTGLLPVPPRFATGEGHTEPALAFWVIKHGVKMTGMPAWGPSHSDEDMWDMVAFLQKLPDLSPEEYRQLTVPAAAADQQDSHPHDHDHSHSH